MVMGWIYAVFVTASGICAAVTGQGAALASSIPEGAESAIKLCISLAGSLCLWTGVGKLMETAGIRSLLARLFAPVLKRLFPSSENDPKLSGALSANFCANLLGLGNAATPMGIEAAKSLAKVSRGKAGKELCRLIVLNTASIQILPTTVAAVRSGYGCETPFDILPAVWVTSLTSTAMGLLAASLLERVWKHA